jgi:putative phage-type endonuclease
MTEPWMIQGSPEWLEYRRSRITATDAATIAGYNPYKTVHELYEEKVNGKEVFVNAAMRRGAELEDEARKKYEDLMSETFIPEVVTHPKHKWMMASLDGVNIERTSILEIKCPGKKMFQIMSKLGPPDNYKAQMTWQMLCSGIKECQFFCYRQGEYDFTLYYFDMSLALELWHKCRDFYYNHLLPEVPPLRFQELDTTKQDLLDQYLHYKNIEKAAKDEAEVCKKLLIEGLPEKTITKKATITCVKQKGQIDYSAIPELKQIDLEKYRKPETTIWRIKSNG